MIFQLLQQRRIWSGRIQRAAILSIAIVGLGLCPVRAEELAKQAHSLTKAPADSAFYTASLRLKEQWQSFLKSNAYNKLMQVPFIQLGKMQAMFQWQQTDQPQVAMVREYLESPAGEDGMAVLGEMFSDEVFAYGSSDFVDAMKFAMEMNTTVRLEQAKAKPDDEDAKKEAQARIVKAVMDKVSSGLSVPTFVMGFRIKDAGRAKRELDEVHSLLRGVLDEHNPELASHLQRDQIGGHEFLTLRVDGSMIPWEQIREQAENLDEEQFNSVREALSKKTLAVALGIVDEYVILSVGSTTDHLEKFGKGPALAEQPAMKRLEKHADGNVVSLSYLSKQMAESMGSAQKTLDDFAAGVDAALVQAKVDDEDRKLIEDDIRSFDISKIAPESGEASTIALWTARGYEMFQYSAAKLPSLDSSKPLSILKHVGGSPLLFIAGRSKESLGDYTAAVEWLKKIVHDGEKIAEKKADEDEWAKYKDLREKAGPLLERLDKATREFMYPALADGQMALVMDATAISKQWFDQMPESPKPLPMLEIGLITSVTDAEKLREGVKSFIDIGHDAYKLVKEANPDDTPKFKVPKAEASDLEGGGKLYTFALPKKWGVNPQLAPNAGLTDKFAAVSLAPGTTKRLLAEQNSEFDTTLPLDHPAAVVSHIEIAQGIHALRPWIDYGMDVALGKIKIKAKKKDEDSDDADEEKQHQERSGAVAGMGIVIPQIEQILEAATVFKSATSMMYEEDGVWVTHSETHIEDLK